MPVDGTTCGDAIDCPYPDPDCGGGSIDASCVDHVWHVGGEPCGPYCPATKPAEGDVCTHPPDSVCWYWDAVLDASSACASCHCIGGKWTCNDGVACAFPAEDCAPKHTCSGLGVGCGTGNCSYYCRCGLDGFFHCSAHVCAQH